MAQLYYFILTPQELKDVQMSPLNFCSFHQSDIFLIKHPDGDVFTWITFLRNSAGKIISNVDMMARKVEARTVYFI